MSCGAGHRCGLDLVFLWLWHRPEAIALIKPLAWKPLYAEGTALKRTKTKTKQKKTQKLFSRKKGFTKLTQEVIENQVSLELNKLNL